MTQKIAIWAPWHKFVALYLRNYGTYRQLKKNLLSSNISSTCSHNMVNFGPLAAEIVSLVWGTPANFNGFRVLAALLHGTLVVGVSQTTAFNRGRHLYSAGRPSRWALAHILVFFVWVCNVSGTAERIYSKFTGRTCLVPRSNEFECQGQRSTSSGTENALSATVTPASCEWYELAAKSSERHHCVAAAEGDSGGLACGVCLVKHLHL